MGNVSTEGAWFSRERIMHIDMLELRAILLVLKPLIKQVINTLTRSFPMHPFSSPSKHQKTVMFSGEGVHWERMG